MIRFKFLLFAAVLAGLTTLAYAGFKDGKTAYDRGDYARALEEFKAAAEQGDSRAQINLGEMYYKGEGVESNDAEAVKWYRRAAEQEDPVGQSILGEMYYRGKGVPKDFVLALMWSNLAASQGNKFARMNIDILQKDMTPDQIAEARRLAREWKPKSRD